MNVPRSPALRTYVPWLGVLGVVYGDIGTSPLYAVRECFRRDHGLIPNTENVIGVLSLIIGSLVVVVAVKYLGVVLRADNRGEGGILALLALLTERGVQARPGWLVVVGIFGAAMLFGDGSLTPAVSVLSAVEGLRVAAPDLGGWVLPGTIVILVALFALQRVGTGGLGRSFGPIMLLWFLVLALLGWRSLVQTPAVLEALNPFMGLRWLLTHLRMAGWVLGAVFLAVTGAEALYADLGHFGARPIRRAWFVLVLPALGLNYLGQGALILRDPTTADHPFYGLSPGWALYPLIMLATLATIIASQALISGSFSLAVQALQLGFLPRMEVVHTSSRRWGQIYVPAVNWSLCACCVGLVLGFRDSSHLAAAYGVAVATTMVMTTFLLHAVLRGLWGWRRSWAAAFCGGVLAIEGGFLVASMAKIPHGGWFPLVVAVVLFLLMTTWNDGRKRLKRRLAGTQLPLDGFLQQLDGEPIPRVRGTAVFMAGNPEGAPVALLHNLKHNKVLHERVVVLTIVTAEAPYLDPRRRVEIAELRPGFYRVLARFGFMEDPTVPEVLERCLEEGLSIPIHETSFFLSRETIVARAAEGWTRWRRRLFALMARNAQPATAFFHLPAGRVVELGMQVEI